MNKPLLQRKTGERECHTTRHVWQPHEVELLRRNYADSRTSDVATALGLSVGRVYQKAAALGLVKSDAYLATPDACRLRRGDNVGAKSRFAAGLVPWNKATHYQAGGRSADTRFKKGTLNGSALARVVPVGSYRINADGYVDLKVSDQPGPQTLRWKAVHRLVWERAHGPVPTGHVVVFLQGRKTTDPSKITLNALELITRVELMRRNTVHNLYPPEVARLVQLRGAITRQINKRARKEKSEENEHEQ